MPSGCGILRRGSKGNAVKPLQKDQNTVLKTKLVVDGDFGPATEKAVKDFRAGYRLTVDGPYGPHSAAMMKAVLAGRRGLLGVGLWPRRRPPGCSHCGRRWGSRPRPSPPRAMC